MSLICISDTRSYYYFQLNICINTIVIITGEMIIIPPYFGLNSRTMDNTGLLQQGGPSVLGDLGAGGIKGSPVIST